MSIQIWRSHGRVVIEMGFLVEEVYSVALVSGSITCISSVLANKLALHKVPWEHKGLFVDVLFLCMDYKVVRKVRARRVVQGIYICKVAQLSSKLDVPLTVFATRFFVVYRSFLLQPLSLFFGGPAYFHSTAVEA